MQPTVVHKSSGCCETNKGDTVDEEEAAFVDVEDEVGEADALIAAANLRQYAVTFKAAWKKLRTKKITRLFVTVGRKEKKYFILTEITGLIVKSGIVFTAEIKRDALK